MHTYTVTRRISATPDQIWPILTDPSRLSDGTFSINKIEGQIQSGETINLWSEVDPKRAFKIQVASLEPQHRMVWQSGLPLGLFMGRREFRLDRDQNQTQFTMQEVYSGPLAGLMFRMIPDLQPSFEKFADGLKSAAEGASV